MSTRSDAAAAAAADASSIALPGRGVVKDGNTCYLAVTLQVLAYLRDFTHIYPREPTKALPQVYHTEKLRQLVDEVKQRGPSISLGERMPAMLELRAALGKTCSGLKLSDSGTTFTTPQEDPSEALQAIINFVCNTACVRHQPLAATLKSRLVVRRHLSGIQGFTAAEARGPLDARRCPCGEELWEREKCENYVYFPLSLPSHSAVSHTVEQYLAMDSASKHVIECANPGCKGSKAGARAKYIMNEEWELDATTQDVVLLHVCRFSHVSRFGLASRNDCEVRPAVHVDLPVRTAARAESATVRYVLKGAILQRGSLNSGHYAVILVKGSRWVLYDDGDKCDLGPADGSLGFVVALARLKWFYARHCYVLVLQREGATEPAAKRARTEAAPDSAR